ncbi:bile salt-activated lipase-like [Trichoplusia ni]|uniref:Carboxylic ester hydrolase n=1 Tax=Trichoplusia ni TaxID=7111 RepID=A0A7E5X3I2_TRINI|nr:bile salt-activated lipase-like [Trichoplusia ni]
MKKLFLVLLITTCCWAGQPRVDPLVSTSRGLIRGLRAEDGDYDMFLGIPYAVVDENNPFGPASPHPGFDTPFDAYHDGVQCVQTAGNTVIGTLQCLQLNVYVPNKANSARKMPVIVYVHGGGFAWNHKGMSSQSPKFLIKHDVIIVSLNYRLGPYGFLCVSEPGYSNQGLKDQLLAIQWLKENIAAFGGDSNEITLMGQSAGAMCLDLLLYTNEKLAKRVILHSGNALNTWLVVPQNDSLAIQVAEELGFTGDGIKEALDYLSSSGPGQVVQTIEGLNTGRNALTRPCLEPEGEGAILTEFPENLKPKVKNMNIIIGHANKEMMFLYPNANKDFYNNFRFSQELIGSFDEAYDEDIVTQFYIGDEKPGEHLQDDILDYGSDFVFVHPTERSIDRYLDAGANVYRFMFTYEGGRNRNKDRMNLTSSGASHGDDLGYLFDMDTYEGQEISEEDQQVIDVMTLMWTDFVKYGDPTPSPPAVLGQRWRAVDAARRVYLDIGAPLALGSRPFHHRMAFWDLYFQLHGNHVIGYKP